MPMPLRAATLFALLLILAPPTDARAQERRDSTRRAVTTSADELHRIRRAWLEQRRLGQLDNAPPVFGSAIVGAPRPGYATGYAVGAPMLGGYGAPMPGGYGAPYGGLYGQPHGGTSVHCDAFVQQGGFGTRGGYGGFAAHGGYRGGSPFGATTFAGRCVPVPRPGFPFNVPGAFGFPGRDGLPYPAYPLYGRFYDRFHPDESRRGGRGWSDPLLFGVQEYDLGWYGPWRTYPGQLGWSDGGYGWYSAPPWSRSPADCIDLTLELANGRVHRLMVGLQSLGLADPRDLDLAIDARLSEGRPVTLQGLDGRVLRIEPGSAIDDIVVRPCGG